MSARTRRLMAELQLVLGESRSPDLDLHVAAAEVAAAACARDAGCKPEAHSKLLSDINPAQLAQLPDEARQLVAAISNDRTRPRRLWHLDAVLAELPRRLT